MRVASARAASALPSSASATTSSPHVKLSCRRHSTGIFSSPAVARAMRPSFVSLLIWSIAVLSQPPFALVVDNGGRAAGDDGDAHAANASAIARTWSERHRAMSLYDNRVRALEGTLHAGSDSERPFE